MEQQETLCFGRFEVRRRQSQLLVDGKPVELGSRAFDVLLALIDGAGMLVTKSELIERGWPGQAVEENNVQVQIHALRRALGRDRDLIQTVAGRGYRFVGKLPRAGTPSLEGPGPPLSIIVLPFHNVRGDPSLDYIVDGITESLITDISRALPGSFVVSRTTSFSYRDHGWMRDALAARSAFVMSWTGASCSTKISRASTPNSSIPSLTGNFGRTALTRSVLTCWPHKTKL